MESMPGTYALILKSTESRNIRVGKTRELTIDPGYYLYIGSAFGPGGVRSRVERHCATKKSKHWHIDYLCEVSTVLGAWISYDQMRLEHGWAETLSALDGLKSIPGFGCTDCKCASHLFFCLTAPEFTFYSKRLVGDIKSWPNQTFV